MSAWKISIIFILSVLLQQPYLVLASSKTYQSFQPHQMGTLKEIKDTHSLAKKVLDLKPKEKKLEKISQEILTGPKENLPEIHLKNGVMTFEWQAKTYKIEYIKDSLYKINDRVVDFKNPNWMELYSHFEHHPFTEFFIPKAEALAPVYFLIWGVVFVLGAGCAVSALSSNKGPSVQAKWIRVDKLGFNRAMEEVRREFKKVCGAANADALVATMDYAKFFGEYCSKVAETVTDDLPRRAPPVRLADQSINPAFLEDMKRRPHVYDLDEFQWSIANNMNVDQYSYGGTNLIDSKPFTQLDGIEQDLIGQFGSSGDFMAECVSASLVPQETSETTEPVVEDTESKSIESEH